MNIGNFGYGIKLFCDLQYINVLLELSLKFLNMPFQIITNEEAERRGKVYDAEGRTYLFDLDYCEDEKEPLVVDAGYYGNVSHFVNHSVSLRVLY